MNSDTTKDYLKSILLTNSEPFREYWDMWGQPRLRDIWLTGGPMENDWLTFEKMVEHFRKDIVTTSANNLFSRLWKRKSGDFTQRANVILCGGVHSVVVFELNDKVVYTKWYGWTPSYFAAYPETETDLALKAVWEGDLEQLMKLGEEGYKLTGGFNSMTLFMKAIWENNFEIVEYLVNHKATRDEVDTRDSAVLKALADIKGNKKIIGIVSSL